MAAKPKKSATKAAVDPCGASISTARAASLLGITAVRVRQLISEGYIEKGDRNRIVLSAAVGGYIRFLKDEERRTSKTASASRVQDARAREIDLKVAEREGRLMDVQEVRDVVAEWAGAIRTGLNALPSQLSRDVAFRRRIETGINDVLRQATDRFEAAMDSRSTPGRAAEADEGDDA